MAAEKFTSYEVDNDEAFKKALRDAYDKVQDLTIPLKLIAQDFYKSERAIFQLKSAGLYPDFGGLKPTAEKTERARKAKVRRVGFDYPLLKASGRLGKSMTDPTHNDAVCVIEKKRVLTLGTKVQYGIFHQSDRPRRKIPQRKFLFIGPEAPRFADSIQMGRLQRWTKTLQEYVARRLEVLGKVKNG